ncbi:AAA family ATPase [Streptomyces sp. NPDC003691]
MRRYRHGLVPGRFYPPHAGHHHLVATAADRCERLTVLVRAAAAESVPLTDRVAWLREVHPDPGIRIVGTVGDPARPAPDRPPRDASGAAALRAAVPDCGTVDAVFTSGAYGGELARRLAADPVSVDPDRSLFPVSGAAVRADPAAHWDYLRPPVRAALTRRVVVLGAESTGTTTLSRDLADHYRARGGLWARTRWVPEYDREFSERKLARLRLERPGADWSEVAFASEEFPLIARRQAELEDEAARRGSPLLICDTDAFATTVRHELRLGRPSSAVAGIAARSRRQHLWLLTDHEDVPYEDDGLRDGERLRPWATRRLAAELSRTGRRTVRLTGSRTERLATAVAAVDTLLAEGWHFADPPAAAFRTPVPDLTEHR